MKLNQMKDKKKTTLGQSNPPMFLHTQNDFFLHLHCWDRDYYPPPLLRSTPIFPLPFSNPLISDDSRATVRLHLVCSKKPPIRIR
ncbi:hypothetical protein JTE90_019024 [Oedothorax gibbosus]|uniref:Uncharacterized protein n=1 Tax=Oedothorax gibbosus TaxID=931172 RepID=A0AAV6UYE3_9ARAC|nr:hypothetical protein JTE90_019024 [Oedothorax gibbosus]